MRLVDPRLLHRARAVRRLLALDVALGVGTAILILAQATLLARIVARGVAGEAAGPLAGALALLALAFVPRGVLAWALEVAGHRTAATVLSELRLELAERRLRHSASPSDGAQSGELAAAAVQ